MRQFLFELSPIEDREIEEGDLCVFDPFGLGIAKMVSDQLCYVSIRQGDKGQCTSPISRNLEDKRPWKIESIKEINE